MLDGYQEFRQDGWRGVARRGLEMPRARLDEWLPLLKSPPQWRHEARSIALVGREGDAWFVKRTWGLGERPKAPLAALKWLLRPARALEVWRISCAMEAAGVGCAPVLLAARRRNWRRLGWPEEVVIMGGVPGVKLRDALLAAAEDETRRREVLAFALRQLASLHQAGFVHGDCNLQNMFLEEAAGRAHFIDNDRTRHLRSGEREGIRRNLVQLGFHLQNRLLLDAAGWEDAFPVYAAAAGWGRERAAEELAWNRRAIAERLKREPPRALPTAFPAPMVNEWSALSAAAVGAPAGIS